MEATILSLGFRTQGLGLRALNPRFETGRPTI